MRAPPESLRPTTGAPHPHGVVHDLADLLRVRLAQRAAEDGKILAEDEDQPPVHRAAPGDDAIAGHALLGHAEVAAAVLDEHVVFLERIVVEEQLQALAGRELALRVLPFDPRLAAAQPGPGRGAPPAYGECRPSPSLTGDAGNCSAASGS